jgi:transcriptional regulator with XRE-family HTH domain
MAAKELTTLKAKIGARIRARRSSLRISQEDLAFRVDLSPTYLSQIEAGKRNPTIDALYRLAHALGIDLEELVKA